MFNYSFFLAAQEVLSQMPSTCNLVNTCTKVKRGPLSKDDFKVASRIMRGAKMSRSQVDFIFQVSERFWCQPTQLFLTRTKSRFISFCSAQIFDLDRDGYISYEDMISITGVDFTTKLVGVRGRDNRLTFAPPPSSIEGVNKDEKVSERSELAWSQTRRRATTKLT